VICPVEAASGQAKSFGAHDPICLEKRTSGAKALISASIYGTAEAVPFV
jgi:hypothetical protein